MQCGICGQSWEIKIDFSGREYIQPYRGMYEVNAHKRSAHPEEYRAQMQKMQDGKKAKKQEAHALRQRQNEAVGAVDRPVVQQRSGMPANDSFEALKLSQVHIGIWIFRYPSAPHWLTYEVLMAQIATLQAEAQDTLRQAWEEGEEVPQEDIDAIKAVCQATV